MLVAYDKDADQTGLIPWCIWVNAILFGGLAAA